MPTRMTQEQLTEQSLKTARELRDSLLRYLGLMVGSSLILIALIETSKTNSNTVSVGSFPGLVAVVLCALALGGLFGSILQGYRLWSYIRVFRV